VGEFPIMAHKTPERTRMTVSVANCKSVGETRHRTRRQYLTRFSRQPVTYHASRGARRLKQPATVRLPTIRMETCGGACVEDSLRRASTQRSVGPMAVVVAREGAELRLQVTGRPEERSVQAFVSNRTDEPFDEGMRERRVGHRCSVSPAMIRTATATRSLPAMSGCRPGDTELFRVGRRGPRWSRRGGHPERGTHAANLRFGIKFALAWPSWIVDRRGSSPEKFQAIA
jgi:hypothetical protein